jgi:hypothetical protein
MAHRLRLIGTAIGIDRIVVQGDAARVTFSASASPRMTDLQKAFRQHQVEVEIRRPLPLSIIFRRAGAVPIEGSIAGGLAELLDRALDAAPNAPACVPCECGTRSNFAAQLAYQRGSRRFAASRRLFAAMSRKENLDDERFVALPPPAVLTLTPVTASVRR